jgi:hypothetical protein
MSAPWGLCWTDYVPLLDIDERLQSTVKDIVTEEDRAYGHVSREEIS